MKKNRTMRVAALLLALTLITSCFVGGTFAKYTSSTSQTDTASVAKWDIDVEGADIADNFTFNLFDTAYTNVTTNKIAPGTEGSFELNIKNSSDVAATYDITYTVDNKDVPLQYSVDGQSWANSLNSVTNQALAIGEEAKITIQWKWEYFKDAAQDGTDTGLGKAASAVPTVSVAVTVNQAQPVKNSASTD